MFGDFKMSLYVMDGGLDVTLTSSVRTCAMIVIIPLVFNVVSYATGL